MNELEKTNRMNALFDFYGSLLNARQEAIFREYYAENLSLAEIAEEFSVSRQAVSDLLARTEKKLEAYEVKLSLLKKYETRSQLLEALSAATKGDAALTKLVQALQAIDD